MATMATTHSLSVLTNASVKPPLNPKTGLSASLHERPGPTLGRFSGIYYDDYDQEAQTEREIFDPRFTYRPSSTDTPSLLHLGNLSDEEFYQKLLQLKNEQRKILQKCEKVYIEKHRGLVDPTFPDDGTDLQEIAKERISSRSYDKTFRSETLIDDDGVLVSTRRARSPVSPARSTSPLDERSLTPPRSRSPVRDVLSDSNGKPPIGRRTIPATAKSMATPLPRPLSSSLPREIARSLDDLRSAALGLKKSFEENDGDYDPDDTVSEPYRDRDRSMTRIEHMWQNFSVDEYTPRRRRRSLERPSSATITRKEKQQKKDSWRHRLTVPEPFSMTLREEHKEKKKSKTIEEFERRRSQKEIEDEEELKKKFKARPVPAHVYLPLFDEIQEKSEEKRRHIRQMSAELLKSQEKPFSFMKREEDRKMHQRLNGDSNNKVEKAPVSTPETFKAKPVPKYIFDSTVNDKMMEEEEYRKIRIKMRAEELMRSAALPPNMNAREQMKEQKEREERMKSKKRSKSAKTTHRPRINHEVPNYDALYRQFQQELQRRKGMRESTVAEPFRLETERTSKSTQERIKKELEKEEQARKENRWPYKLPTTKVKLGHMSSSLDALPAKSTRAADARSTKTRRHVQQLTQKELQEIEEDRRRRVKEMRLRREIAEKTKARETPRENPEETKRKFREAERARMEEYERELEEMKTRISQRPLLFEQESQVNARKKAEKKFNATLRSVGLDEDFVQSRGSRSASVHDHTDSYDDDFEETAVRREDETYTKRRDSNGSARRDSEGSMSPVES